MAAYQFSVAQSHLSTRILKKKKNLLTGTGKKYSCSTPGHIHQLLQIQFFLLQSGPGKCCKDFVYYPSPSPMWQQGWVSDPGLWAILRSQWNRDKVLDTDTTPLTCWKPYKHLPQYWRGWHWSCPLILLWHHRSQCSSFDLSQANKPWRTGECPDLRLPFLPVQGYRQLITSPRCAWQLFFCTALLCLRTICCFLIPNLKVCISYFHYQGTLSCLGWFFQFLHPILDSQRYLGTVLN